MTGLKKDLEVEQALRVNAKSSLQGIQQSATEEMEKVKASFDTERVAFETEKAALIKRAEEAESWLAVETQELQGLKHHITNMTVAIFGTPPVEFCLDKSSTNLPG